MRGGQKRPSGAGAAARGETAMGTLFILILLAIVGFAATYSVLSALPAASPSSSTTISTSRLLPHPPLKQQQPQARARRGG
ncbi:hypothetical protein CLOM_g16126 [Closterium sp. NIES-68]|nr:hypothetical protein CLOM_g16126 [Closterium sp. NIES-68]